MTTLLFSILILLYSCDAALLGTETFDDNQSQDTGINQGTIEVSIPGISSQLYDELHTDIPETQSRALIIADQTIIDLVNSSDTVIDSITIGSDQTTAGIPADPGTGYTLRVRIFNLDTDPVNPVVSGISDPFEVFAGETTNVHVRCTPENPAPLTEGIPSATTTLIPGEYNSDALWTSYGNTGSEIWFETTASTELTASRVIPVANSLISQIFFVYDSTGAYQGKGSFKGSNPLILDTVPGETYYIGVVDFNVYFQSELQYPSGSFQFICESQPPYTDGNDTISEAVSLTTDGSEYSSEIGGFRDYDFFEISLEAGKDYYVDIAEEKSVALIDLYEVDPEGPVSLIETKTQSFIYTPPINQTIYMIIYSYDGHTQENYTISVQEMIPFTDGNDSFAEVQPATVGESILTDNIGGYKDIDYFSVDLEMGKLYSIETTTDLTSLSVYPYDSSQTPLNIATFDPLRFEALSTGIHYLMVYSGAPMETGNYSISISEIEPYTDGNDSLAEAAELATDGTPENSDLGSFDDKDYYRVSLEAGLIYQIEQTSFPVMAELCIYDPALNIILPDQNPEDFYFEPESTGVYILEMANPGFEDLLTYTLSVTEIIPYTDGNDSFSEAVPLPVDGSGTTADLGGFNDTDYFSIAMEADTTYSIAVSTDLWTLETEIYDSSRNLIQGGSSIVITPDSSATYYLMFYTRDPSENGDYTITVTEHLPVADGNDDFADALTINAAGTTLTDNIGILGDADYFSVTLTQGEMYSIEAVCSASVFLSLYDESFIQQQVFLNPLVFEAPATGTYYIKVQNDINSLLSAEYDLSVTVVVAFTEGNDSFAQAAPLVLDGEPLSADLGGMGDKDYYSVDLVAGTYYSFNVPFSAFPVEFALYNSSFEEQATDTNQRIMQAQTSETYFIKTYTEIWEDVADYTVSVSEVPLYADANDSFAEAVSIPADGSANNDDLGGFGDRDYFSVLFEAGKQYLIEGTGFGITLQIALYDSSHSQLSYTQGFVYEALSTSEHFITVYSSDPAMTGPYSLSVSEIEPYVDGNDSFAEAEPLESGVSFSSAIGGIRDRDYYSFTLSNEISYGLETASAELFSLELSIYDEEFNLILVGPPSMPLNPHDGILYVKVECFDQSETGNYDIILTEFP